MILPSGVVTACVEVNEGRVFAESSHNLPLLAPGVQDFEDLSWSRAADGEVNRLELDMRGPIRRSNRPVIIQSAVG